MRRSAGDRLLVCYLPGFDLRRITAASCPHVASLLGTCPWVTLRTLPTVEHIPTMLTGTFPHQHGLWGPRLTATGGRPSFPQRLIDRLPDVVTTTAQGLGHLLNGPVDLATMAPRRRRRFDWVRFKYVKLSQIERLSEPIDGLASILTVVGRDRGRYLYHEDYRRLPELLDRVATGDYALEIVEEHCLDRLQHWRLDQPQAIAAFYRGVDDFVERLHDKCRKRGFSLLILSDHGMEPVTTTVDIFADLRAIDVAPDDYDVYVENTKATFWFHSPRARALIAARLSGSASGVLLAREDLRRYRLEFTTRAYGDAYYYAKPGCSFFPNDFYQPLASTTLALLDWQQRPRLRDPRHRGDHGYLPEHVCERGFVLLADERYETAADSISLIDVAPTLLALLGHRSAPTMRGRNAMRRRARAAAPPAAES